MKLLHCADVHLDSNLTSVLGSDLSKTRKIELLRGFENMICYADDNGINSILIAGDLFDTDRISVTARKAVRGTIEQHPQITFYYLRGNHDKDGFLSGMGGVPDNLKFFGESWTSYPLGGPDSHVVLTGAELGKLNSSQLYTSLVLDGRDFNIVILHGQESEVAAKDKAVVIDLKALRNKGIDYLALGHIHSYKKAALDKRGIYCYPGCLEGRGYDECGEHGFVVLDIDERTYAFTQTFIRSDGRTIHEVNVDVSDCVDNIQICQKIQATLDDLDIPSSDYIRIVLTGATDVERDNISINYIHAQFKDDYYHVKVKDQTTLRVNYDDYLLEKSLKGEFVRLVKADGSLSEDDKAEIIRCGFEAIGGSLE